MLAGRIRYAAPLGKKRVRDGLVLGLDNGMELRYHDPEGHGEGVHHLGPRPGPGHGEHGAGGRRLPV